LDPPPFGATHGFTSAVGASDGQLEVDQEIADLKAAQLPEGLSAGLFFSNFSGR
jgi:hypothetical protein